MRRSVPVVALTVLLALSLTSSDAWAKGSTLRFERESYQPGDRAVAHAIVETWPGSGQPDDGPYAVYLVRGRQPLWYGHLPNRALPVGELRIGSKVTDQTEVGDSYKVTVAFDLPAVSDGRYAVWVCRKDCGANSGFGDLVYGELTVTGSAGATARPDSAPGDANPTGTPSAMSPWPALGLATVLAVVSAMTLVVMRRRRAGGS